METIWHSLVFPLEGNKVLLARKARKIGVKKYNGFGGKVEPGETIRDCAVRELKKESGLSVRDQADLEKAAICTFVNNLSDGKRMKAIVVVFLIRRFEGEINLREEEMYGAEWFDPSSFPPASEFMPADPYWVPLAVSGLKVQVKAEYTLNQERLISIPSVVVAERI